MGSVRSERHRGGETVERGGKGNLVDDGLEDHERVKRGAAEMLEEVELMEDLTVRVPFGFEYGGSSTSEERNC